MRRLAGYINYAPDFLFQAVAFTNPEGYIAFESEHTVDFLLCGSFFYEEALRKSAAGQICYLSDREEVAEGSSEDIIFKFQSAEEIKKEILRLYQGQSKESKKMLQESNGSRIIGFVSPVGGCFCSTLALAAAALYAEHCRTAFVSFDPFLAASEAGVGVGRYAVTEAVYLIRRGEEEEKQIAELAGFAGGFDYYVGCLHWADLTEIEPEEAERFLWILSSGLEYQTVIVDIGAICRASAGLFAGCHKLYEPFFGTAGEEEKHREWLRQCQMNDPEFHSKMMRIRPPYDERLADGIKDLKELTSGVLGKFMKELLLLD